MGNCCEVSNVRQQQWEILIVLIFCLLGSVFPGRPFLATEKLLFSDELMILSEQSVINNG